MRALELRKAGCPYREIASLLGVDVRTAHGDIAAELAALRDQTVEQAQELRVLELQRLDAMNVGLWPQIRAGSPPHVTAGIRVAERRARLLGLDAPVVTKNEFAGSLSVAAEKRLAEERELFGWLSVEQLEVLAAESQALVDKAMAMAMVKENALTPAFARRAPGQGGASDGEPAEKPTGAAVACYVDGDRRLGQGHAKPSELPVGVSPSDNAGVDNVVRNESTEPPAGSEEGGRRGSA